MKQAYQLPNLTTIYVLPSESPSDASAISEKPSIQYVPDGKGGWKLPDVVPNRVTKRQALLVLLSVGIRESDIRTFIASLADADREVAEIEFNYATHFERKHPLIQMIADAKGLDRKKLDTLFIQASKLFNLRPSGAVL